MTNRERYHRALHYEDVDYVPFRMVGGWGDTFERWYGEGLPRDVNLRSYLGVPEFEIKNVSGNTEIYPWFETRTISEDDEYVVRIDEWRRTVRDMKHHSVIPEWIDFPVKSGRDLEKASTSGRSQRALKRSERRSMPVAPSSRMADSFLRSTTRFRRISPSTTTDATWNR